MKKNWTMRAGVLMVALTMITSCFVGGTFAKYTTSKDGSDSARVAKFGVTVTGTGTTFAKEYNADDSTYTGVTVQSTENVVAPGTKGDMAAFTLSGTPEVAVKVTYEATEFDLGDNWAVPAATTEDTEETVDDDEVTATEYYRPPEIKVGADTLKGSDYQSTDAFETAVKEKIAAYSKTYAPGTDLSTKGDDKLAVSWSWAFEDNDDVKDTYLGDQAASDNAATISLKVTATVTRID